MNYEIENEGDQHCPAYKIYISEDFNFDSNRVFTESNMKDICKLHASLIKILGYDKSNIYIENICILHDNKLQYKVGIDYLEQFGIEKNELNRKHDYFNSIEYVVKDIINKITIHEKIKILKDLVNTEKYNELEKYIVEKILEEYDFKRSKEYNYTNFKNIIENIVFDYNIGRLENMLYIDDTYYRYLNLINEIKDEEIMNGIKNSKTYQIEEDQLLCLAYIKTVNKLCKDLNLEHLTMDIDNKVYNIF